MRLAAAVPIAAAAALAWACQRSGPLTDTLRIAHEADVSTLDPVDASDHISISVLSNVYDPLVDLDPSLKLVPGLAVSWTTPEPKTWVFRLRQGVPTHDGGVLGAEDVRASIERARTAPTSSLRTLLAAIESVEVPSPGMVRIRTREPDPLLAVRLVSVYVSPGGGASAPLGSGPYRFVRRAPGLVELEAFPDHWRGRPSVARVRFVPVPPGPRTLEALEREDVDVLRWVPEELTDRVAALPGVRVERHPSLRALYLWMGPAGGSPFADARVRRAVSLAIDRDALAARIGSGNAPLWTFVPRLVYGHIPGHRLIADALAARRLLAEAGHARGLDVPLVHAAGGERIAQAVSDALAGSGIRARPEAMEWPAMRALWQGGRLPLFIGSWRFEAIEASLFIRDCVHTRSPATEKSWNPGFSSARLDGLIEENFRLFDDEARYEHFDRLWAAMADEMPLVPLVERLDVYAVRSRVRWAPRGDGNLRVAEMSLRP
ncbi:MAG TPA: ABC transporter substrate-binding protein [Vicinamibacteria bacterium]|nr:ABC transporter substrate-binding protein [Vicinamibacteria bacterium]